MESLKTEIEDFLKEWSSCDNRSTRFPYYWTIKDFKEVYNPCNKGEYYFDCYSASIEKVEDIIRTLYNDGDIDLEDEDITIEDIISEIGSIMEDSIVETSLESYLGEKPNRFELDFEPYFEGIFLTEKDAEEYLESCLNHHTDAAIVYLECFNRWSRDSRTEKFFENLFNYFNVPIPPNLYKEKHFIENDKDIQTKELLTTYKIKEI